MEEKYQPQVTKKLFKKLNWLKAAILTADKVITVSPHYALEITSGEELGVELDDCLRSVSPLPPGNEITIWAELSSAVLTRKKPLDLVGEVHIIMVPDIQCVKRYHRWDHSMGWVYCRASGPVVGIVNGMDIGDWSPLVDKYITQRYGKDSIAEGKQKNKEAVQAVLGLPVCPLLGLCKHNLETCTWGSIVCQAITVASKECTVRNCWWSCAINAEGFGHLLNRR